MANVETKSSRAAKNAAENVDKTAAATAGAAKSAAKDMADAAFSYPKFEVPEMFRSFAEQGLTHTRETYQRLKAAAEEATDLFEDSFEATRESVREAQFKALDAAQESAEATFDLVRKLLTVRSAADAIQLQTAFARERFEAFVDYSKDVQTSLNKVGAEAGKPAKALFERALTQPKAA
jgi:phasin